MTFRWIYIVLPTTILLAAIVLAASFYGMLPPEVAYHFEDGLPDRWMGRGSIIAWTIIPQIVLVVAGLTVTGIAVVLSKRFRQTEDTSSSKVLAIMGNMVALPQLILTFAMLDIFLYNSYRIHLIPLWVFALVVMVLGGVILGIFFIQAVRQFRGLPVKNLQE